MLQPVMTGLFTGFKFYCYFFMKTSMNPEIDIGQVEGAFIMGLGYWLSEQAIYDTSSGLELTSSTWVGAIMCNYHNQNVLFEMRC